jgi:hypothetical protein
MAYLIKAALIEYGSDFLGPLPNVVLFQFNPETLTRNIQIPPRPTGGAERETSQAGEPSIEKITLKAEFSAADGLNTNNPLARTMGVGPRLAALEKMVHPSNIIGGAIGAALSAVGGALGIGGGTGSKGGRQLIPRENYPRILFIWGPFRLLPVSIESMSITEQQYDFVLNPVRAEVNIGLMVKENDIYLDDIVAKGALKYSSAAKEAQAIANLANTIAQVVDLIPL